MVHKYNSAVSTTALVVSMIAVLQMCELREMINADRAEPRTNYFHQTNYDVEHYGSFDLHEIHNLAGESVGFKWVKEQRCLKSHGEDNGKRESTDQRAQEKDRETDE